MTFVAVENTWAFRFMWARNGAPWAVNVLHGIPTAGDTLDQAKANKIAADIKAKYTTQNLGGMYAGISLKQIGIRSLDKANEVEYLADISLPGQPTITNALPPQLAVCVTLRTAKAGRSYRGRVYVGGFGIEVVAPDGSISADGKAVALTNVQAWKDVLDANGVDLAVASRKLGKSEPVTQILVRDSQWDTQRRRVDSSAW